MAVAEISVKEPSDITTCPLCDQLLTDPDVLPCYHAYCANCLAERGDATELGHCPLCNTAYTFCARESSAEMRSKGSRFVVKMVDLKRIMSSEDALCVLCLSERLREDGAAVHRSASTYCVDCRQNYCEHCIATHDVINPLQCHRVVERGKPRPLNEALLSSSFDRCDRHVDKQLELYCKLCKKAICFVCSVETPHHTHDRIQLDTVLDSLRNGMRKDIGGVSAGVTACQTVRRNLQKISDEFTQHVGHVKAAVESCVEHLSNHIDHDEQNLLACLARVRDNAGARFQRDRQEVEHHLSALVILKKYLIAVKDHGTACDVASLSKPLHDRTADLKKFDVTKRVKLVSHNMVVSFVPGFGHRQTGNFIGSLEEKTVYKGNQLKVTVNIIHFLFKTSTRHVNRIPLIIYGDVVTSYHE